MKFIRKSIRVRLAVTFIGIMCLSLAAILLVNTFFLEKIYTTNKEKSLKTVYKTINSVGDYSSLNNREFVDYLAAHNFSLVIVDPDTSKPLYSFAKDADTMYSLYTMYVILQFGEPGNFKGEHEILESTDSYILEKRTGDSQSSDAINMFGKLDNSAGFLLNTPIQSIKESARISNVFYLSIGLVTICVSSVIIWFMSRKITRPLQSLTTLSQEMANLNFNVKYTDPSQDEIGILGNNLNKMSRELEQTISELKTANNELQKDIEKKTQIDEMRKEFLANVSHELKTPIALIQGYAEGLQECINEDQESRDFYCDVIIDEAVKMNSMVKKLLSLNQLEFGNDQVTMERFDLSELVRGVVQSAQLLADQKGASLDFVCSEPVYVWGDEFKLEEVVTNYISNALNHVDHEKKIEVKIRKQNGIVRLSVYNTGEPIPEGELDKIWIKFYKVDKARTREYGGSGIGLSIVKAIMDSMHQKCGVINYDNGVEFWFELQSGDMEQQLSEEEDRSMGKGL